MKKLIDCNPSEIRKALSYVYITLGLTESEMPNDNNQLLLAGYIKSSYPHQSINEIKMAFDGAMQNRFSIDEKKQVNDLSLYGKIFSASYFSLIMNCHLQYVASLPVKQPESQKQLPDGRTIEEKQDAMLRVHEKLTEELQKIPEPIDVLNCFSSLHRNKKLDYSEENLNKIKKSADENVQGEIDYFIRKGRTGEARNARLNKKNLVRMETKKLFIIQHLTNLLK